MTSWVKTITTPFRKARTFFNNQQSPRDSPREKKSQEEGMYIQYLCIIMQSILC